MRIKKTVLVLFYAMLLVSNGFAQGKAISFDGVDDYLLHNGGLNVAGASAGSAATISVWVKIDEDARVVTDPLQGYRIVGHDGNPSSWGFTVANVGDEGNKIYAFNKDSDGVKTISTNYVKGEWVHLTWVHGGGNLTFYKDSEVVGTVVSGDTVQTANWITFGARREFGHFLDCDMDNFQLWNVALTESQVEATSEELTEAIVGTDSSSGISGIQWSNLIRYFKFEDNTANSAGSVSWYAKRFSGYVNSGANIEVAFPENLTVLEKDSRSFTLTWDVVADADNYTVVVAEDKKLVTGAVTLPNGGVTASNTFKVDGLTANKTYYYGVKSNKGEFSSQNSTGHCAIIPNVIIGADKVAIMSNGQADLTIEPVVQSGLVSNIAWSKASGPGSVTFDETDQTTTNITFNVVGEYELELYTVDIPTGQPETYSVKVSVLEEKYGSISRAQRVILDKGLQLDIWINDFGFEDNPQEFADSGFKNPFFHKAWLDTDSDNTWSRVEHGSAIVGPVANDFIVEPEELPYVNRLNSIQYGDEEHYASGNVTRFAQWYEISHKLYPNALVHNNQWYAQWNMDQFDHYMRTAKPDIVSFDSYVFSYDGAYQNAGGSVEDLYKALGLVRTVAMKGHNGSGEKPIAFGHYLQGFRTGANGALGGDYVPTESQINSNYFSAWTFGAKWVSLFRWRNSYNDAYALLHDADGSRSDSFATFAKANKQSLNLSPFLSKLLTHKVAMIPGLRNASTETPLPPYVSRWNSNTISYVSSLSAENIGVANGGRRGDVLIGSYKPVLEELGDDNLSTSNKFFMIYNGLTNGNGNPATSVGSASETAQRLTVTLSMTTGETLHKVNRDTGAVEEVAVTSLGDDSYELSHDLGGGEGDLFIIKADENDFTKPTPEVSSFAVEPNGTDIDKITMTATTSTDSNGVQYYFECTSGAGNDSGWQNSPVYTDTGLKPDTAYSYSVKVRDMSLNQNITTSSSPVEARTLSIDLSENLVAHWTFDEASGTSVADVTGNGYDGSFVNSPSFTSGVSGTGISFASKSDSISINKSDLSGAWSASFWIKRGAVTSTGAENVMTSGATILSSRVWGKSNAGFTKIGHADYTTSYYVPVDEWVMLTYVSSGGLVKLYANSELKSTISASITMPMNKIGGFIGELDELRVYTNALGVYEISELYEIGMKSLTPAIGIQVSQTDDKLTWTVEDEIGVKEYQVFVDGELFDTIRAEGADFYTIKVPTDAKVKLVVVDESGYKQTYLPEDGNVNIQVYDLKEGWNLIAITSDDADLETLKDETVGVLWGWNGSAYEVIEAAEATDAVWVYSPIEKQVYVSGTKSDAEIKLDLGWNMVGPVENDYIPADADTVYSWSEVYDVIAGEDKVLIGGKGYWIFSL